MSIKVLLAEDDPDIIEFYKLAFPAYGIEIVDIAVNGQEAVAKYRAAPEGIDLLVMDHLMPVMNGLEAADEIRSFDQEVKIIIGSADPHVERLLHKSMIARFQRKPFAIEDLLKTIETL